MARLPSKDALKQELLHTLREALATLERAQKDASEAATHEEAKAEDDKDTRAIEQSYLARGQAARVEALQASVAAISAFAPRSFGPEDAIALGALVTTDDGEKTRALFLAPQGGGTNLAHGAVQVVTPESPLGRALLGRRAGDDVQVLLGGQTREFSIAAVE